jgi:hypothetical protein
MSWRAVPGPEGPALLAARGRAVVTALMIGQAQRRVEERQGAAWK